MASPSRSSPKPARISVNDLALYMVSTETARMGIIRRAYTQPAYTVTRYKDVRAPIRSFLSDLSRNIKPLVDAENMLRQRTTDPSERALRQEDARLSIEVLRDIQGMGNHLGQYNFLLAPRQQNKLMISGVEVSVRADLLLHGQTRGVEQIGAAILRVTKDDATTPSAKEKRKQMGLYVSTLIKLHVDKNIFSNRETSTKLCMSIDVQHGEVFCAPTQVTRRINDIDNACRIIASFWGTA